jgi:hypothetical protein
MVGKKFLGLQLVGECLLENITALCVFYIMYIPLCIYLSLRCLSMCMLTGYFLCITHCSFLGWLSMNLNYCMCGYYILSCLFSN